jgi:hypothetical protein
MKRLLMMGVVLLAAGCGKSDLVGKWQLEPDPQRQPIEDKGRGKPPIVWDFHADGTVHQGWGAADAVPKKIGTWKLCGETLEIELTDEMFAAEKAGYEIMKRLKSDAIILPDGKKPSPEEMEVYLANEPTRIEKLTVKITGGSVMTMTNNRNGKTNTWRRVK